MERFSEILTYFVIIAIVVGLAFCLFKDASQTAPSAQAATKEVTTTGGWVLVLVVLFGLVALVARGAVKR